MISLPVFVGLDYHKDSVQVCVLNAKGKQILNRRVNNDVEEVAGAIKSRGQVTAVGIEACCGAANMAEELIRLTNWPVQLAHPGYVARLKQSPDKTDFSDARLLADLARVGYLPKVWLAPDTIRRLRRLVRHRQQLVAKRRNVKLRMRALLRENRIRSPEGCNAWTKAWLAWVAGEPTLVEDDRWMMDEHLTELEHLTTQIKAVEQRLAERTADDPVVAKLLSLPGVGLVTALTLRAEIGRFDRFQTGKQLGPVLWCDSAKCQFRSAPSRCRFDQGRQSSTSRSADRTGPPAGQSHPRSLEQIGVPTVKERQTEKRSGRREVANRWIRWLYHQMQPELPSA